MASRPAAARPEDSATDACQPRSSSACDAKAASILLVDDDDAVLDTFARMLRLKGYEVTMASRPEDGLKEAERGRPDAIILDFRMPLLDGLGLLRRLRAFDHLRNTPVAMVTGDYFLDDAITNEVNELGAVVLFKPLWLEQLVELARTLLTKSEKGRKRGN